MFPTKSLFYIAIPGVKQVQIAKEIAVRLPLEFRKSVYLLLIVHQA